MPLTKMILEENQRISKKAEKITIFQRIGQQKFELMTVKKSSKTSVQ